MLVGYQEEVAKLRGIVDEVDSELTDEVAKNDARRREQVSAHCVFHLLVSLNGFGNVCKWYKDPAALSSC